MVQDPLSDRTIEDILNSGSESERLDFKEILDFGNKRDILQLAKDLFALANTQGGHIIVGVTDDGERLGVPADLGIDATVLGDKVDVYCRPRLQLRVREYFKTQNLVRKKFIAIYVEKSDTPVVPTQDGNFEDRGRPGQVFRRGDIIVRKGAKSERADEEDFRRILEEAILRPERIAKSARLIHVARTAVLPDAVQERIVSNLFPIVEYPKIVWSAATDVDNKEEALGLLEGSVRESPSFIIRSRRLYSFSELRAEDNPLRVILSQQDYEKQNVENWRNDPDKWRWFVEMFNVVLRRYCQRLGLVFHPEISTYYFPADKGEKRVSWGPAGRKRKVTRVVSKCQMLKNGTFGNCVHQAFRMWVRTIGDELFLQMNPRYVFTRDGLTDLVSPARRARLHVKYEYRKGNPAVLYSTFFWMDVISTFKSQVVVRERATPPIVISKTPMSGTASFGIAGDTRSLSIRSRTNAYETLDPFLDRAGEDEE